MDLDRASLVRVDAVEDEQRRGRRSRRASGRWPNSCVSSSASGCRPKRPPSCRGLRPSGAVEVEPEELARARAAARSASASTWSRTCTGADASRRRRTRRPSAARPARPRPARRPARASAGAARPARAGPSALAGAASMSAQASDGADERDERADAQAVVERVDERLLRRRRPDAGRRTSRRRRRAPSASCWRAVAGTLGQRARRAWSGPSAGDQRADARRRRTCRRPCGSSTGCRRRRRPWSRSTAFIAAVLIGDMTRPMPRPIRTNGADEEAVARVDVEVRTARTARPRRASRPAVISGRGPMRSARRPAIGADDDDHHASRAGSARRPRSGE